MAPSASNVALLVTRGGAASSGQSLSTLAAPGGAVSLVLPFLAAGISAEEVLLNGISRRANVALVGRQMSNRRVLAF